MAAPERRPNDIGVVDGTLVRAGAGGGILVECNDGASNVFDGTGDAVAGWRLARPRIAAMFFSVPTAGWCRKVACESRAATLPSVATPRLLDCEPAFPCPAFLPDNNLAIVDDRSLAVAGGPEPFTGLAKFKPMTLLMRAFARGIVTFVEELFTGTGAGGAGAAGRAVGNGFVALAAEEWTAAAGRFDGALAVASATGHNKLIVLRSGSLLESAINFLPSL